MIAFEFDIVYPGDVERLGPEKAVQLVRIVGAIIKIGSDAPANLIIDHPSVKSLHTVLEYKETEEGHAADQHGELLFVGMDVDMSLSPFGLIPLPARKRERHAPPSEVKITLRYCGPFYKNTQASEGRRFFSAPRSVVVGPVGKILDDDGSWRERTDADPDEPYWRTYLPWRQTTAKEQAKNDLESAGVQRLLTDVIRGGGGPVIAGGPMAPVIRAASSIHADAVASAVSEQIIGRRIDGTPPDFVPPIAGRMISFHGVPDGSTGDNIQAGAAEKSIPMLLWCPACHERHIDVARVRDEAPSYACMPGLWLAWRPAIVPTVGVQFLPGFKNEPTGNEPGDTVGSLRNLAKQRGTTMSEVLREVLGSEFVEGDESP